MKRMIAILLAVLTMAALLTGCSGRNNGNVSTTNDGTVNGRDNTATVPNTTTGTTAPDAYNNHVNPADRNDAGTPMENFGNDMKDAANDVIDGIEDTLDPNAGRAATHREPGVGMQGER